MRYTGLTAAFAAAIALAASAPAAHAQKALVYCPVTIDAGGCDRIVSALKSKFADSVDRGFDGSSGTLDLKKIDLQHYAVFVVPSLADDANKQPYALLRSVAPRLHMAINGRVAVYSGAPDQGAANRADKDALIQNLARWAANGHTHQSGLVGLVAFLDLSEKTSDRYSWVHSISLVEVSADEELQAFGDITPVTSRGGDVFSAGGKPVRFSNMASYGLHIGGHGAARTEVSASGGGTSRQSVLVQYSNADGASESVSSTGRVGSSGASFSLSGTSATMSASTSATASGPTLATDKPDYQPGDTVTFTGTGWTAGDSVTITLHEDPHWTQEDRTVIAVADGTGNFTNHTFVVDERDLNVTFTATAVGNPSGLVAQMTFTDSKPNTVAVGAQSPNPVLSGSNATYSITVAFNGNASACTAGLIGTPTASPAWPAPPTGGFFTFSPSSVTNTAGTSTLTVKTTGMVPNTYQFTVTADGSSCSQPGTAVSTTINLVVTAPPTTTTVSAATGTFGGTVNLSAHVEFTAGGNVSGATVNFSLNGTALGSATTNGGGNATLSNASLGSIAVGTYPTGVSATVVASATAATSTGTNSLTVNPAIQTLTITGTGAGVGTVTSTPAGINCTSTAGTTSGTCSFAFAGGAAVTLTATPSASLPTAAGSTFAAWTGDGTGTTTRSVTMDAAKAVTAQFKANQTMSFTPPAGKTYGDADFDPAATATSGLAVTYTSSTASVCTIVSAKVHIVTAGTCTINADQAGDATNYNAAPQVSRTFTIGTKTLTVTFTAADKTYDGANTAAVSACVVATGKVGSDDVTCSVGSGTFASANASASAQVVSATATLGGAAAANYAVTNPVTSSAKINAKAVTVTFTAADKEYDATNTAAVSACAIATGKVGTDDVTCAVAGGTFASSAASASTQVVSATATLGGTAAGNYAVTNPVTSSAKINPKAITITPNAGQSKIYGATDPTLTSSPSPALLGTDTFTGALSRVLGENVGNYAITLGTLSAGGNYSLALAAAPVNFAITAKPIVITPNSGQSKIYGAADPILTYTPSPALQGGDSFTGALGRAAGENVSTYAITLGTLSAGTNYSLSLSATPVTFAITTKTVTVSFAAADKVYDGNNTASVSSCSILTGKVGTDDVTCSVSAGTFASANASPSAQVVSATATLGGTAAGNYAVTNPVTSSAKISAKAVTVTFAAADREYDGTNTAAVSACTIATGKVSGDDLSCSVASGTFASANASASAQVVSATATLSGGAAGNYSVTNPVTSSAKISPKPVTVTPTSGQTKVYGDADPALTFAASPVLFEGDVFTGALSRAPGTNVGPYAITLGTLSAGPNYTVTLSATPVNFTITAKPIVVTPNSGQTKIYGYADPTLTYTASPTLLGGDSFSGALSRANGENVGSYAITLGTLSAGTNYSVSLAATPVNFTITARTVTVTFTAADKVYDGNNSASVSACAIATGKLAADDLTCTVTSGTFASANASASAQAVSATATLTGTAAGNYTVTNPVTSSAKITPKAVTVTFTAADKDYDGTNTAAVSACLIATGKVASDDVTCSVASGTFASANANASAQVVSATASLGGGAAGNYAVTNPVTSSAKINPKAITVTPNSGQTKVYGYADPTLTFAPNPALLGSDGFTGALSRVAGENVGTYAITLGNLAAGSNYSVSLSATPVTFAITARTVTVSFTAADKVYDGNNTASVSACTIATGKVSGDDLTCSVASGTFASAHASTSAQAVSATATLGGAAASNYVVTNPVASSAKINAKPVTVTFAAADKEYDGTNTAAVSSCVIGAEKVGTDDVTCSVSGGTFASANANASAQAVSATAALSGAAAGNYTVTNPVTSSAKINAKPITITPTSGLSKVFGSSDPTLTYTPSPGLLGSDAFAGALSRVSGENVGTYAITIGNLSAGGNYTLTLSATPVTFAITPKPIVVTPNSGQTKIYGYADPTLTYTASPTLLGGDSFSGALSRAGGENVGSYAITLGTLSAGTNYSVSLAVTPVNFTITAKTVTVTFTAADKVYDGNNTASVSACAIATGKVPGDDLTCTVASGTFASANASASAQVVSATASLGGAAAGNYAVTNPVTSSAKISQKPVTVTFAAADREYDGTNTAAVSACTIATGKVSGDDLSCSVASGTFASANASVSAQVVSATATLSGGAAGNYSITNPVTSSAKISPKPVTITPTSGQTKVFGEVDPALTFAASPVLVEGDAFSGALSRAPGSNVGPYVITLGTLSAGPNYTVTLSATPVNFTITPKPIVITPTSGQTKIYGYADPTLSYTASPTLLGGDTFSGALSRTTGDNVGAYAITLGTLSAGTNYSVSLAVTPVNFTITARTVTVTFSAADKVYDGNNTASVSACAIATGKFSTDDITCTVAGGTFASANASASAQPVSGTATLTGTAAGNYTVTNPVTSSAKISQKAVTVTFTAADKMYDKTNTASVSACAISTGKVGIDNVTCSVAGGTFASYSASTSAQTVSATASLGGSAASNYSITNPVTTTALINTRPITVTPSAPALTWTGSPLTPAYTYVVSVNTVISGDLLGTPNFSPATVTNVGPYVANVSGLVNSNYAITPAAGTVNVIDHSQPIGSITQLNPVPLNLPATLNVNISDVTTGNSNIVSWKYSIDGVYSAPITVSAPSPNATLTTNIGSFSTTDVKEVCVTGQDAGGNWSVPTCGLLAVYDPSAGFVTGGGWFMSPAGAYAADPSLTGKANFGFVSKYQKGANVPTGNTEFQFKEGNLNFSSTSFSWLVIQGTTQAQFKGTGTINGSGSYNFLVTAIDGDAFTGTKKPDSFRIKITDSAGIVVYDNQMGADETGTASTVISGGSIQIQSK